MAVRVTHLSLFSGIGGMDLAAEWADFHSVGMVEWDDYCHKVLNKHWPSVPKWRDICEFTGEQFRAETGLPSVTLISGGFPCQPFSQAGKRRGKEDDRYLWPEMLRVIKEIRPTWVVGENVAGFVNMGLEDAILDLEDEGYQCQSFLIPACAVQAPHERKRVFIVANTSSTRGAWEKWYKTNRCSGNINRQEAKVCRNKDDVADTESQGARKNDRGIWEGIEGVSGGERAGQDVADTENSGNVWRDRKLESTKIKYQHRRSKKNGGREWWKTEPTICRVVDGIPSRVDRLRCLGNAVVPQQVYPILESIAKIERGVAE